MFGQLHVPAALPLGKQPQVPNNWGLFWFQNQSRRSGDSLPPPEILIPDRPALNLGIMTTELFWICCKNFLVDMSSGFDSYPLNLITVIHVIHKDEKTQRGAL